MGQAWNCPPGVTDADFCEEEGGHVCGECKYFGFANDYKKQIPLCLAYVLVDGDDTCDVISYDQAACDNFEGR